MDADSNHPDLQSLLDNGTWVRDLVRGLLYDKSLTEDVVQEVWITALTRPPRAAGALRTWLFRVARALAFQTNRSEKRRQRREMSVARREGPPSVEEIAQAFELRRELENAVLGLDEPYRTVVYLRYFESLSPAELAAQLSVNESTVRTQLSRAMERLREQLDRRYHGRKRWHLLLLSLLVPETLRSEICSNATDRDVDDAKPPSRPAPLRSAIWMVAATSLAVIALLWIASRRAGQWRESALAAAHDLDGIEDTLPAPADRRQDSSGDLLTPASNSLDTRPAILVLDSHTQEPVAGALVYASLRTEERSQRLGQTDSAGMLTIEDLVLRREALQIVASGYLEHRESARLRDVAAGPMIIELERQIEASVLVLLPDGSPAAGARVTINASPRGLESPLPIVLSTDSSGEAKYLYSWADTWITAELDGNAMVAVPASTPVTTLRLVQGIETVAQILDAQGTPIQGGRAEVTSSLSRARATIHAVDGEGRAALGSFAESELITLTVRVAGEAVHRASSKPSREPWTVKLPASSWARGHVSGPDGDAVAGAVAFVMVERSAGPAKDGQISGLRTPGLPQRGRAKFQLAPLARAAVGADGSFTVGPIADGTDSAYLLIFHPTLRDHLERLTPRSVARFREVRLEEGPSLSGRVVKPSGEPFAGVLLHLGDLWSNDMESMVGRVRTGADGSFAFQGLPKSIEEPLAEDPPQDGARARRTALFLTAFAPDLLIERRPEFPGAAPDEKSLLVEPGEAGIEIVAAASASSLTVDLRMRDELGRAVHGWMPALLLDASGSSRIGGVGGGGERRRFFADSTLEVGDGRGCEVFLMPPENLWARFTVPGVTEGAIVDVQLSQSRMEASASQFLLPDGSPLSRFPVLLEPFPGGTGAPIAVSLGMTDENGWLDLGFLERDRHRLHIARDPSAGHAPNRGSWVALTEPSRWLDLGTHEVGDGVTSQLRLTAAP